MKIEGLRFSFSVEKTLTGEPNTCKLTIYNLNATSRGKIKTKGDVLILKAGYEEGQGVIFIGNVTKVFHERQGPDWVTSIEASDGLAAIKDTQVSKSWAPGTTGQSIVEDIAKTFSGGGVKAVIGEIKGNMSEQFANGFSVSGLAKNVMDKMGGKFNFDWSFQDGTLQVIPRTEASSETAVVLSQKTGMIGSPAQTEEGVKVKSLMNISVKPGRLVSIKDSPIVTGYFKVSKVNHSGDTHGTEWYTDIEAVTL
jgi:hypothetical protein